MSQWNASSDFWMSPAATLPESSTAQAWTDPSKASDEQKRRARADPSTQQSDVLQWQDGLDMFSDRDMFPNSAPSTSFSHPAQAPRQNKASRLLGDMSYTYPYAQSDLQSQIPLTGNPSAFDADAPLPKEYQNYLTGSNAAALSGFSGFTDPFQPAHGQQDTYGLGQWSQDSQIPNQPLPPVLPSQTHLHPGYTTRPDTFDATSSALSNEFNFQFNDHALSGLNDTSSLGAPTLQFHAPHLTDASVADYNAPHLSENFVMPSTEGYHGYGYQPNVLSMGSENIGLAIAGPPPGSLPQDSYSVASITPGRSDAGASSLGKSLSPRTTEAPPHRGRIPSDAKAVLEQHFEHNAYPTKEEVEQLANRLGLKPKTVKNWFGNTRQRRPCSGKYLSRSRNPVQSVFTDVSNSLTEPTEGPPTGANPITHDGEGNPIPTQLTKQTLDRASLSSEASSIERFEQEPIEDGPVSLEAIERAAPTYKTFLALNNPEELAQPYTPNQRGPRSVASSNGDSTGASSTSGASGLSSSSAKSATSLGRAPRRGRRRYRHNPYGTRPGKDDGKTDPLQEAQGGKATKYHCTWCFARFARPYEWKRHQETLHVPRQVWVCTPGVKKDDLQPPQVCPYCMKLYPDEQHLQEHNYYTCAKKSISKRTFARKDHLFQHIRQVHLKHADDEQLNQFSEWRGEAEQLPPESRALWCGFCRRYHSSWEKRVKDVARHFGEGEDLSTWWDPDVGWLRPSQYKDTNLPLTVTCRCCAQPKTFDNQQDARRHYESTGEPWQLELDLTRMRFHTRDEVDKHRNYMSLRTHPRHFWSCYQIQDLSGCITPAGASFKSPQASPASPSSTVPLDTCNFCGEPFPPDSDYGMRIDHLENKHQLRLCKQTKFYDVEGFRSHLKHRHRGVHGEHTRALEKVARRDEKDPPVRLERSPSSMEAAIEMQGLRSWSVGGDSEGGKRPKLFNALSGMTKKLSSFRKGAS
ncbi:MAG: hypothetical protein Q9157_000162 [Trypethelium eluteriae]